MGDGEFAGSFAARAQANARRSNVHRRGLVSRAHRGPWRDLPERFGSWKTIYNPFSNWSLRGHWASIFKALQLEKEDEAVILDASVVRAHQDAAGGKGGSSAMLWVTLEVGSPRKSTRSSTAKGGRSTSSSRKGKGTSPPSPKTSSRSTRGAKPRSPTTGYDSTPSEVCSETSESRRSSMRTRHERTRRDSIASATRAGIVSRCSSTV